MELNNKVLAVTGGGNGIGREVVLGLIARGSRVAALDLSEAGLEGTAKLATAGEQLTTHVVNITDRTAVLALPEQIAAVHGPVDGLITSPASSTTSNRSTSPRSRTSSGS